MNDARKNFQVRGRAHAKLLRISEKQRLKLVDLVEVLVFAWDQLTPEQQREAVINSTNQKGRKAEVAA